MSDAPTAAAAAVQAVTAPTEAKAPETAAQPQALDQFARKEKQIREMQRKLDAEKASWKTKIAEYETGYVPKERLKSDALGVLQELGVGYEQLTEMVLAQPNDPATKALVAKIRQLEDKQRKLEEQSNKVQTDQTEQAKKQISTEVKQFIDSGDYQLIKGEKLEEAVSELIFQTFEKDGYIMDYKEAADSVETHLEQQALKMSMYEKIKAKSQPAAAVPVAKEAQTQTNPKTLTNNMQSTPSKKLSDKERVERAKAAFYGKLT